MFGGPAGWPPAQFWSVEQLLDVRPRQLCPTRGDERGPCSATIRVDRAVSEVYTASRSATWAMAISACCRSSRVVHMVFTGRQLRGR
ncbi:hypothetical protein GWK47_029103 [Chionoecetes opilio]|uniref:Uncharacterized protein n=1 Tax=Chionoecetes opilio TaxID=41210 RepID=A0A8J4YKN3_CHIOP|nr:hypothetical protein GWK47_029103 [Chionoecetes opilio]